MVYTKKVRKGEPSARAKASCCVRIRCEGFDCKVNKTRFKCPARKPLYKYLAKCYEKVLRRESYSSLAIKEKYAEVRAMVAKLSDDYLKSVPVRFHSLPDDKKKEELKRLLDETEDDVADKLGLDLEYKRNGGAAIHIANDIWLPQYGGAARNRLDHPEGRPPTSPHRLHLNDFAQLEKLWDADLTTELLEALDDDTDTRHRNRLNEIYAEFEGFVTPADSIVSSPFSKGCGLGASNFDNHVEGHILTCEQKLMLPEGFSEALQVLPPVNLRKMLPDIHPLHNNMVGYIQTEPLTSIPNQTTDQRYGVYNAPFTEEGFCSSYYPAPDLYGSDPYTSTADCHGTSSFTITANCFGPHSYASQADCYGLHNFTSTE